MAKIKHKGKEIEKALEKTRCIILNKAKNKIGRWHFNESEERWNVLFLNCSKTVTTNLELYTYITYPPKTKVKIKIFSDKALRREFAANSSE